MSSDFLPFRWEVCGMEILIIVPWFIMSFLSDFLSKYSLYLSQYYLTLFCILIYCYLSYLPESKLHGRREFVFLFTVLPPHQNNEYLINIFWLNEGIGANFCPCVSSSFILHLENHDEKLRSYWFQPKTFLYRTFTEITNFSFYLLHTHCTHTHSRMGR